MKLNAMFVNVCPLIWVIVLCGCNQMDPHVFPTKGPFFEGWYMRIIDQHAGISVGWLFSRILTDKTLRYNPEHPCTQQPPSTMDRKCLEHYLSLKASGSQSNFDRQQNNSLPIPYYVNAIILINPTEKSKLSTEIKYFPLSEYSITQNGQPIKKNPDDATPPHFEASIGKNVSFIVRPNGTMFSLHLGHTIIRGETDHPVPWGPNGEGPESWIDKLPLPLHWFVYSLRSNVIHYEVKNEDTGLIISGGSKKHKPVVAHMEKNWGAAFPKAWVWAQGVDPRNNVSFAVSSGLLTELGIDIPAQLSNYRNPQKGINCKFNPLNSFHKLSHDGCTGKAYLRVEGIDCHVHFDLQSNPVYLSDCLTIPEVYGYTLGCVESYNAVANVTVYQRHGLHMVLADSYLFNMTALEFGGEWMCGSQCPSK